MNEVKDLLTNERFLGMAFIVSVALIASAMVLAHMLFEGFMKLKEWAIAKSAEEDEFEDRDDPTAELYCKDAYYSAAAKCAFEGMSELQSWVVEHNKDYVTMTPKENIWGVASFRFHDAGEMFSWLVRNIPNSIRRTYLWRSGIDFYDLHGYYEIEVESNWMRKTQ